MLDPQEIQIIQDSQPASIHAKMLVDEQLQLIYQNNWFNLWVPKEYGGEAMPLPAGLKLLEELAYWDGSLAWTVTLCSGANMFAGFIDPDLAANVFAHQKVCLGGSGRVAGRAVWDGKRYHISGEWPYATGAPHLTHFTLSTYIYHGDKQQFGRNGEPLVRSFFVPKEHVLIHYDWDTFGLESTASHSFTVSDISIEPEYCFQLDSDLRMVDEALFRIPFRPFADVTLLVNYIGMYQRFLDLAHKYFFGKSKDPVWEERYSKHRFQSLDRCQLRLDADRQSVDRLIDDLWSVAQQGEVPDDHDLVRDVYSLSRAVVRRIREATIDLYPLLGIKAAQREEQLNIVFRNIFTATQHSLLNIPQL